MDDGPTALENWTAAAAMAVLSAGGIVAYAFVFFILLRGADEKLRNPFYTLVLSLGVSDTVMLVIFLFYTAPATVLQAHFLGQTVDVALGVLCNVGWYSALPVSGRGSPTVTYRSLECSSIIIILIPVLCSLWG